MSRDIQFEVQYILSLAVGTLGLIGSKAFSDHIQLNVIIVFLIIAGSHLILLSTYYTFEKAVSIPIPLIEKIGELSVWSLRLTTLSFIYLVGNIVSSSLTHYAESETNQGIIAFGLPLLPVVVIVIVYILSVLPFKRFSDDVSITIVPEAITVFESYQDGKPGQIEIINDGDRNHEFDIVLELPENVYARYNGEEHSDKIEENLSFSGKGLQTLDLQFRHDSSEPKTALTRIKVEYLNSEREINWETILTA